MLTHVRAAIVSLVLFSVVTGVAYPALVTVIAQLVFPHQANGSLIVKGGKPMGSTLIGQGFDDPKYFWGRPSATSPFAYNAGASVGLEPGPNQRRSDRDGQGPGRCPAGRGSRQHGARAGGPRHGVGQWARPATSARRRRSTR